MKNCKKIFFFSPYIYIRNDQMTKDTVWIPYLLHKRYGYEVNMFFSKEGNNSYPLMQYVEGINFMVQDPPLGGDWNDRLRRWTDFVCGYIKENHLDMDILYCFGSHYTYNTIIPCYKKYRPDGKVIIKLDANIGWMNDLTRERVMATHQNADIITVEGKRLMKYLNRKWPLKVKYLTNGSVEYAKSTQEKVSFEGKKNIILTVARIGTAQKANHIMLEAFAKIAHEIPEYTLRLVGGIEESFKGYIEEYYKRFPELKERVVFVGRINEKQVLEKEYREAKIFCLTSMFEGGTPNVVSEAMRNGCYMIASEYDAYQEQICFGKCGSSFPINDIEKLADIFVEVCRSDALENVCYEIQKYKERLFDYERQVAKLNYWLTHLEG